MKKMQKIASCVTHPKEAHMLDQTDVPSPGTDVYKMGTHLAVTHAKTVARGGKVGPADPMGRPNLPSLLFRCIFAGDSLLSSQGQLCTFPCEEMAGIDLKSNKRGISSPTQDTPLEASLPHTLLVLVLLRVVELG